MLRKSGGLDTESVAPAVAHALDASDVLGGQKDHVFICYVENVEIDKIGTRAISKRLYHVKNVIDDLPLGSGTFFGMTLDGRFKVVPGADLLGEREFGVLIDGSRIGFDQHAVSVVEADSQIVNDVAKQGGRMFRKWHTEDPPLVPRCHIELGSERMEVSSFVGPESRFKLRDVMCGPFGL